MKIIHEVNQLEFGGVEKIVKNIIKYDKDNQHQIIAYKDGPFRKQFEAIGAEIVLIDGEDDIDFEADIIHIHTGGGDSNLAHNLGKDFPIIETIHSPVKSILPDNLITERIGVTEEVTRRNTKCTTILNGIDIEESLASDDVDIRKHFKINENELVIGRLGRLGRDKGLEEWILTCYYLQKKGHKFTSMIVGNEALEHDGYRGKLRLMIDSLPLKNVIFVDNVVNVGDYLKAMDIFLYPSASEGFGLVYVEAMLNEALVVAYNNPVTLQVCGGYSLLTKENSIEGLVDAMEKATNQHIRDAILPMAKNAVITEFNAETMVKQYQYLYQKVKSEF